ncbi:MAG: hypothetical protein QW145_01395 [Candidatus Bathyarchaeia archaeon]
MRLKYWIIRLTELVIVFLMLILSIHSLISSVIYEAIIRLLTTVFPQRMPAQVLALTPIISLSVVFISLYALGKQKCVDEIYVLSWLIHAPTVLSFSQIDWPKMMGLPVGLQDLRTDLGFMEALIVSLALIAGRLMLVYMFQIREFYRELLSRGAEKEDLERAFPGMLALITLVIGLALLGVVGISLAVPAIKIFLLQILASVPYPYVTIITACLVAIPTCVMTYIYSQHLKAKTRS